jgi:signal transducing adaptor molecule
LLRLAADRTTHAQVKQKVLERMGTWTEQFGKTPELGIMEQAYQKLRVQQPGLMPPSKPVKQEISADDRRKEEEELQMALALSIKDKGAAGQQTNGTSKDDSADQGAQSHSGAQQSQQGTTAATVSRVRALYDFTPSEAGELPFRKGDVIAVLESVYKDWWKGSLRGNTGIFPLNYVEKLQDPTKEELERDAQMEGEVFGEIKNVEKLLALLSVRSEGGGGRRGEREEEEISELYQRALSIRPKLIELIGKYSQKKGKNIQTSTMIFLTSFPDDFTQLNEKFIKARRDYEALLESSMSQPQYQQQFPVRQRPAAPQMYPPQQGPGYGGPQQAAPPQNYPPQAPPSAQGYPPQQPYAQRSQQHLPPQQDVQRYYSPAPSEPPGPQQPGYGSPYPQQNGPPAVQPSNGPAPFHFIPGGLQGPPPAQQQEIRRKPSPQGPVSAGPGPAPSDPYSAQQAQQAFQGQIRPNSIHTLNSGNPQELATTGYESPIDNRHSYPSAQQMGVGYPVQQQPPHMQPPAGYDGYPPQQHQPLPQQRPPQPLSDRDALPSRQRTSSFESPSSVYSGQPEGVPPWNQQPPAQPSAPPPGVPGSPPVGAPTYQYQAYQPQQPPQQRLPSGGSSVAGGDPGDFYR